VTTFVSTQHDRYLGSVAGDGHCVAFVREVTGAPHTAAWRRGALVRGGSHPSGALIATFDEDGRYANATDGSSHAAVLISVTAAGLVVTDQWRGQPVAVRTIRFKGGQGPACDDADRYHVVVTDCATPTVA
jgi:hypothetical protein